MTDDNDAKMRDRFKRLQTALQPKTQPKQPASEVIAEADRKGKPRGKE